MYNVLILLISVQSFIVTFTNAFMYEYIPDFFEVFLLNGLLKSRNSLVMHYKKVYLRSNVVKELTIPYDDCRLCRAISSRMKRPIICDQTCSLYYL